jgi:predicted XRE-type DNA-binding protein
LHGKVIGAAPMTTHIPEDVDADRLDDPPSSAKPTTTSACSPIVDLLGGGDGRRAARSDGDAASPPPAVVHDARRMLVAAITGRIHQQHLGAAAAARLLGLTGPRVSALLDGYVECFTADELISMLPCVGLTIQVVAAPA